MKANSDIAPEIPEADFNEAKVAFEESLGSNFGTASILEEEEEAPTLTSANPSRMSKVLFTMRQISQSDHRTAGILALTLGAFGMHKFYLGYHEQGFFCCLLRPSSQRSHLASVFWPFGWSLVPKGSSIFPSRRKNSNKFM